MFSGTGTRRLGTLKLARTSVIVWRAQGSGLRVRDSRTKLIQATGPGTGATVVAAGVHRAVLVTASGRWRLEIRAL